MIRFYGEQWPVLLSSLLLVTSNHAFAENLNETTRAQPALASSAGMLLIASPGGKFMPWCTVSMIQADKVITAFHCVTSTHVGDSLKVFFPYEGLRAVDLSSIKPFCKESPESGKPNEPFGCSMQTDDLVIFGITVPYSLLQPSIIGQASSISFGSKGTIEGFGLHNVNSFKYGIKHEGEIVMGSCEVNNDGDTATSAVQGRVLCFRFSPSDPSETGIGPFDSGGPMFSIHEETGEHTIIGVARGSQPIYGTNGEERMANYVNLTDSFYQNWLAEAAAPGNSVPTDFSIKMLAEDEVQILKPESSVDYTFDIGESCSRLILTLNHDPGPSMLLNNLDIQLPGNLESSCERHASVEVCTVENPPAGTYQVSVGWGKQCGLDGKCTDPNNDVAYQMTAIALYENPSVIIGGHSASGNE